MATLSLTLFKAKILKDGRHRIRIAVRHRHQTAYIVTDVTVDSEKQFRGGQVVRRPDAAELNGGSRNLVEEPATTPVSDCLPSTDFPARKKGFLSTSVFQ